MKRRDPLESIVDDAQAEVRAQIAAGGRVRDFAAMIARARALDPEAVPAEAAAEVTSYARVVALRRRAAEKVVGDAVGDAIADERTPRRVAPRRAWIAGAAAAILLGVGLVGAATLARREATSTGGGAASLVSPPPSAQRARIGGDEARADARAGGPVVNVQRDMSAETLPIEPVVEDTFQDTDEVTAEGAMEDADVDGGQEAAAAPEAPPPTPAPAGRSAPARPRSADLDLDPEHEARARALAGAANPSWDAIDHAAREAWRRGDLGEARALLGAIVAADSDAARVELAFGDLLVLARQVGDARGLKRARRDYLRRFPAGTYAEDARAGLCRDGDDSKCWRSYVERWPDGAHAAEARRALGE